MGEERKLYRAVVGNTKERAQSEDWGVFGSLGLELILGTLAERVQSGSGCSE
jgi:hypothetical protein